MVQSLHYAPSSTPLTSVAEQLMGEQLMSGPGTRAPQVPITDMKVCRSYLVGTCPHDLFTNTKQDFGPCPKLHNEGLKTEYEAADAEQKSKWGFEYDYLRDMQKYVDECNRRIDSAQRRLEKTPDEIRQTNTLVRIWHTRRVLPANLIPRSSKPSTISENPSRLASRKSAFSVKQVKSIQPFKNSSRSANSSSKRKIASVN